MPLRVRWPLFSALRRFWAREGIVVPAGFNPVAIDMRLMEIVPSASLL